MFNMTFFIFYKGIRRRLLRNLEVVIAGAKHRQVLWQILRTSALKHLRILIFQSLELKSYSSSKDVSPSRNVVGLSRLLPLQVRARWLLRGQSVWNPRHLPLSPVLLLPGHAQIWFALLQLLDRPSVLTIWYQVNQLLKRLTPWVNSSKCYSRSKLKNSLWGWLCPNFPWRE